MNWSRILLTTVVSAAIATLAEAGVLTTPERHIIELAPGETKTVEYQVYNSGPQDIDVELDPEDWSADSVTAKVNIASWLFLDEPKLSVKVNETRPFKVSVKAPKDIDGELLAMIFLAYKEDKESMVNIRNGVPLYLVVKGTERYGVKIDSVNVAYDQTQESGSLSITVKAVNNGNIHIVPDITVSVKESSQNELKKFEIKESKIILRGRDYTYQFTWVSPMLPEGVYSVSATLSCKDRIKDVQANAEFEVKGGRVKMLKQEMEN